MVEARVDGAGLAMWLRTVDRICRGRVGEATWTFCDGSLSVEWSEIRNTFPGEGDGQGTVVVDPDSMKELSVHCPRTPDLLLRAWEDRFRLGAVQVAASVEIAVPAALPNPELFAAPAPALPEPEPEPEPIPVQRRSRRRAAPELAVDAAVGVVSVDAGGPVAAPEVAAEPAGGPVAAPEVAAEPVGEPVPVARLTLVDVPVTAFMPLFSGLPAVTTAEPEAVPEAASGAEIRQEGGAGRAGGTLIELHPWALPQNPLMPSGAPLAEVLGLRWRYDGATLGRAGVARAVTAAHRQKEHLIGQAAALLEPLGVPPELLERWVEAHLEARATGKESFSIGNVVYIDKKSRQVKLFG